MNTKSNSLRVSVPLMNVVKFKEVLLYILSKVGAKPNVGQTVIYKLLYFIDFDFYELYEEQILGLKYIKNTYGPTPTGFDKIIKQIDSILEKYSDRTATELSAISHRDVPWITTKEKHEIPYESVFYRTKETSVRVYDK